MSWFKVRDGRVVYAGAISRAPYVAWIATKAGSQAMNAAASQAGFRLFGAARARSRVWREIRDAARSEDGCAALQAAADLYLLSMSNLAYASGLPRTTVGLRRMVLVPRTLASGRARPLITARLAECQAFAQRPLAERDFLFEAVLLQADAAVRGASPSVRHPIRAADGWSCIGADTRFAWVDQVLVRPGLVGSLVHVRTAEGSALSERSQGRGAGRRRAPGLAGHALPRAPPCARPARGIDGLTQTISTALRRNVSDGDPAA